MKKFMALVASVGLVALGASSSVARERTTGRGTGPVVYVASQDLFFDSIVVADLPAKGRFQQLFPGVGPSGLATDFGPGDIGYLGGRWWVDVNANGEMDDEDDFFLCPLLGPGRSDP